MPNARNIPNNVAKIVLFADRRNSFIVASNLAEWSSSCGAEPSTDEDLRKFVGELSGCMGRSVTQVVL
jgi:hypothetical protein